VGSVPFGSVAFRQLWSSWGWVCLGQFGSVKLGLVKAVHFWCIWVGLGAIN
jgi:hypothetical protein